MPSKPDISFIPWRQLFFLCLTVLLASLSAAAIVFIYRARLTRQIRAATRGGQARE
jgi:hypothetical protein